MCILLNLFVFLLLMNWAYRVGQKTNVYRIVMGFAASETGVALRETACENGRLVLELQFRG